jgi:hypothetical protein
MNAVLLVKLNINLLMSYKSRNSSHTYKNYFPKSIGKWQPSYFQKGSSACMITAVCFCPYTANLANFRNRKKATETVMLKAVILIIFLT